MSVIPFAGYDVVDLSVVTGETYPANWPTSPMFHTFRYVWYDDFRGSSYSRMISIEEHHGTHFDVPAHVIPPKGSGLPHATEGEWMTPEKFPLTCFMSPVAVVDCRTLLGKAEPGNSPQITREYLENWEKENGKIQSSEFVMLFTSWTELNYKPFPKGYEFAFNPVLMKQSPAWPAPNARAMELLVERGVKLVGIDGAAMGPAEDDFPPHLVGLSAGLIFVEKMTNFSSLPVRGAYFMCLPLRIEGGSGGPCRAIAFVPQK